MPKSCNLQLPRKNEPGTAGKRYVVTVLRLPIDKVRYHFFRNGNELMFFRDKTVKSGSVDVLAALNWLVSQDLLKSTDIPTQLEYGVEICSTNGPETFPLTSLTFSLK
jgi:hypothetical protein